MNIYPAYNSKYNLIHKKQIIFLMIANGEGEHCFTVIQLSALVAIFSV